mmetsp:Transcript_43322/g.120481  ORF Transcript_43322/g.120481 Transcript_43322/m.120481 type:complete len:272 (-) Transcript_43322:194-1009(-)
MVRQTSWTRKPWPNSSRKAPAGAARCGSEKSTAAPAPASRPTEVQRGWKSSGQKTQSAQQTMSKGPTGTGPPAATAFQSSSATSNDPRASSSQSFILRLWYRPFSAPETSVTTTRLAPRASAARPTSPTPAPNSITERPAGLSGPHAVAADSRKRARATAAGQTCRPVLSGAMASGRRRCQTRHVLPPMMCDEGACSKASSSCTSKVPQSNMPSPPSRSCTAARRTAARLRVGRPRLTRTRLVDSRTSSSSSNFRSAKLRSCRPRGPPSSP